jgi:hypothetical protein
VEEVILEVQDQLRQEELEVEEQVEVAQLRQEVLQQPTLVVEVEVEVEVMVQAEPAVRES